MVYKHGLIRISGLIIIVLSIKEMPAYFGEVLKLSEIGVTYFLLYWIPLIFTLLFGYIMMKYPSLFSWVFVTSNTEDLDVKDNILRHIGPYVIISLGLYLLISSISDFFFHISNFYYSSGLYGSDYTLSSYNYPYFIATIIEFISAIIVIFIGNSYRGDNREDREDKGPGSN